MIKYIYVCTYILYCIQPTLLAHSLNLSFLITFKVGPIKKAFSFWLYTEIELSAVPSDHPPKLKTTSRARLGCEKLGVLTVWEIEASLKVVWEFLLTSDKIIYSYNFV